MENYFWNTETESSEKKVYILIIYDIVSNRRRVKFAKKMEGYGFRVQKSAFEAMVPEKLYRKLLTEIPEGISEEEDTVRIYKIYGFGEVVRFGIDHAIPTDDVVII